MEGGRGLSSHEAQNWNFGKKETLHSDRLSVSSTAERFVLAGEQKKLEMGWDSEYHLGIVKTHLLRCYRTAFCIRHSHASAKYTEGGAASENMTPNALLIVPVL